MSMDETIRTAIIDELRRQADNSGDALRVEVREERLIIDGAVNLDDLIMVIAGSLAGGP
jgi:hypothetical protein